MSDSKEFLEIMSRGEDLPTRLRAWAEIISIPSGPFVNEDMRFAANEIERLRDDVAEWQQAAGVEANLRREFLARTEKAEAAISSGERTAEGTK